MNRHVVLLSGIILLILGVSWLNKAGIREEGFLAVGIIAIGAILLIFANNPKQN